MEISMLGGFLNVFIPSVVCMISEVIAASLNSQFKLVVGSTLKKRDVVESLLHLCV